MEPMGIQLIDLGVSRETPRMYVLRKLQDSKALMGLRHSGVALRV